MPRLRPVDYDPFAQVTQDAPEADPWEGVGLYRQYLSGLGSSLRRAGRGARQLLTDVAAALPENPVAFPVPREIRQQEAQRLRDREARIREEEAPLRQSRAYQFGDLVGTGAQLLTPGAALRGTHAARAFLPATLRGNVAQGAAVGALQPVAGGGERTRNTTIGGALGGAGHAVGSAIGRWTPGAREAMGEADRLGLNLRGTPGEQVQQLSEAAGRLVPDSRGDAMLGIRQGLQEAREAARQGVDASYDAARASSATIPASEVQRFARNARQGLLDQGFDLEAPEMASVVRRIADLERTSAPIESAAARRQLDEAVREVQAAYAARDAATQDMGRFMAMEQSQADRAGRFYPVAGAPRFPGRYSFHPERAAEAGQAAQDASRIASQNLTRAQQLEASLEQLRAAVDPRNRPVQLRELEQWRRRVNAMSPKDGSPEMAASTALKRRYDDFMTDLFNRDMIEGSPDALQAWRQARGDSARFHSTFNANRVIRDLATKDDLTPEQMRSWLFNVGGSGAKLPAGAVVKRLNDILGAHSPQMQALRSEVVADLADPLLQRTPNIKAFLDRYDTYFKRNPTLIRELFPEGAGDLQQVQMFARGIERRPGARISVEGDKRSQNMFGSLQRLLTAKMFGHGIAEGGARMQAARSMIDRLRSSTVGSQARKDILREYLGADPRQPMFPTGGGQTAISAGMARAPDAVDGLNPGP